MVLLWPGTDQAAQAVPNEESANADVKLIMVRRGPRSLLACAPHLHTSVTPLRNANCRSERVWYEQGWEDWTRLAPSQRVARIAGADMLLMIYGASLGEQAVDHGEERSERERLWEQIQRQLKAAVRRLHENLGHANTPSMLRALRV